MEKDNWTEMVKSQKHLLPSGDWNQFALILIIVVLSGEILALVLVKELRNYKTERHL